MYAFYVGKIQKPLKVQSDPVSASKFSTAAVKSCAGGFWFKLTIRREDSGIFAAFFPGLEHKRSGDGEAAHGWIV